MIIMSLIPSLILQLLQIIYFIFFIVWHIFASILLIAYSVITDIFLVISIIYFWFGFGFFSIIYNSCFRFNRFIFYIVITIFSNTLLYILTYIFSFRFLLFIEDECNSS